VCAYSHPEAGEAIDDETTEEAQDGVGVRVHRVQVQVVW
jgi:hypothetical protein